MTFFDYKKLMKKIILQREKFNILKLNSMRLMIEINKNKLMF